MSCSRAGCRLTLGGGEKGLQVLSDQSRRRRMADSIIRGHQAKPQTDDEWAWADEATVRMIGEEPW
jgi:hypothetical protein